MCQMVSRDRPRILLFQLVLPLAGYLLLGIGVALLLMAFLPLPAQQHLMIDTFRQSAPVGVYLWAGLSCFVAGAAALIGSRAARNRMVSVSPVKGDSPPAGKSLVLERYDDQTTADTVVGLLQQGGVPAKVEVDSPVPGLVESVRVIVPAEKLDQARAIINQQTGSKFDL